MRASIEAADFRGRHRSPLPKARRDAGAFEKTQIQTIGVGSAGTPRACQVDRSNFRRLVKRHGLERGLRVG